MPDRVFYRMFKNRRQTVQFAVVSTSLGYAVMLWQAADDSVTLDGFFDFTQYGSTAACRQAAANHAQRRAKETR